MYARVELMRFPPWSVYWRDLRPGFGVRVEGNSAEFLLAIRLEGARRISVGIDAVWPRRARNESGSHVDKRSTG